MKIGDFAWRNFLRIEDKVYNLDTEGVEVNNKIRFSKKEAEILKACLLKRRKEYISYLERWLVDDIAWELMKVTLGIDCREEIQGLLENPEKMF